MSNTMVSNINIMKQIDPYYTKNLNNLPVIPIYCKYLNAY